MLETPSVWFPGSRAQRWPFTGCESIRGRRLLRSQRWVARSSSAASLAIATVTKRWESTRRRSALSLLGFDVQNQTRPMRFVLGRVDVCFRIKARLMLGLAVDHAQQEAIVL